MKTAILAGCTGLIGSQLLPLLLSSDRYERVIAISRRPLTQRHNKLSNLVFDFAKVSEYKDVLKGDDVFCCLGTTMKKAGSKEAFRQVDLDYPVALANVTRSNGSRQFLLVTAGGANKNSIIFYSRVKGEVEEKIARIGFDSFHIFQPSLLLGERTDERKGERIGKALMNYLEFLIPAMYKPIESTKVARAMAVLASQDLSGTFIHDSAELQSY